MRQIFIILILLCIISASELYAETALSQEHTKGEIVIVDKATGAAVLLMHGQVIVAPNGETIIAGKSAKLNVQVTIGTHEVDIGKPSDEWPEISRSSCTYSRYPCSIVDYIDILVNNQKILVPRSVFCDLSDINKAEVKIGQKKAILLLSGGDASESYVVKIEFDSKRVRRKISSSGEFHDEPSAEIIYRIPRLKDE